MKKSFFYAICVMALATMVGMISCKKEKEPQVEAEVPQADAQMQAEIDRIVGFKKQVETRKANPGTKSAETVTLDEAMNNIVDLFNVTYTEPMAYYTESERHEFTLNVALTADGKVLLDDVVAAYEQALANAREAYHGSNLPDKAYQRLMVTCTPQRDGTADLKFDGKFGTKADCPPTPTPMPPTPPAPQPFAGPFGEGDDWHYMRGMGSCDGLRPGGADIVLSDTLMKEVRAKWPSAYPPNERGVFINLGQIQFTPTSDNTQNVFFRHGVTKTCIGWEEMNELLHYERILIFQTLPSQNGIVMNPTSLLYDFFNFVTMVEVVADRESNNFIRHNTYVEYGCYMNIGGIIDPIDL